MTNKLLYWSCVFVKELCPNSKKNIFFPFVSSRTIKKRFTVAVYCMCVIDGLVKI